MDADWTRGGAWLSPAGKSGQREAGRARRHASFGAPPSPPHAFRIRLPPGSLGVLDTLRALGVYTAETKTASLGRVSAGTLVPSDGAGP